MVKRNAPKSVSSAQRIAPQSDAIVDDARGGPPVWAVAVMLAFLIGAVYGPRISVPFVSDDRETIMGNPSILQLWPLVGENETGALNPQPEFPTPGRPVINLSFALNYH